MLSSDIRLLSPTKLGSLAKFYGLRQQGRRGIWVIRKSVTDPRSHTEKTIKRSTKTTDLRLALHRASTWVDEFIAQVHGQRLPSFESPSQWASLKQIADTYLVAATCSPLTRRKNLANFKRMVGDMCAERPFEALAADIIDGRFARQWLLSQKEKAETAYLPKNVAACEQAKRGANALYRQARSVFSRRLRGVYADAGLRVPSEARDFAEQSFLPAAAAPPAEQLSPAVLAKIARLLPRLKDVRPGIWTAFWLMYRGGLRNSEASKARWGWLTPTISGGYVLTLHAQGDYKPKANARIVSLAPDVVALLRTTRKPLAEQTAEDHIIPGETDFERSENCGRKLNKFLHACGVSAIKGKVAYRLRGHAITEIMLADGMPAAQEFAGHTSAKTTAIYKGAATPYTALKA